MGIAMAASSLQVDINVTIDNRSIIIVNSDINPSVTGQTVTFTATVRATQGAGVPTPTGLVTFTIDGLSKPPVALPANGRATISTAGLSAGDHLISAHYSGDAEIQSSDSPAYTQTVKNPSNTTLVSSSPGVPAQFGTPVTFTATVATGATGNVTFYIDGIPQIPAVALSGGASNQAALITSSLSLGVHSIMASYPGDPNFAPSTSNIVVQDINATPVVTLTSGLNPATIGQSVTYTASVGSILGNPSGWVVFTDTTTIPITQSAQIPLIGGSASATFTVAAPAGSHTITADYSGDANFASATGNLNETVNLATTLTLSALPPSSTFGQSVAITASLSPVPPSTTSVTFLDGTTVLGTAALSSGSATLNITVLAVGTHSLNATYPGDPGFGASSGALSFTVSRAVPTVTLVSSANPSALGQSVTFTASVDSPVGNPAGTVTFVDTTTSTTFATVTLTGGIATVSHTFAAPATDTIVATYNGDTNFASAGSNAVLQIVANNSPIFTSTPVLSTSQGDAYVYHVTTSDPDAGAVLNVSATVLPTWLTLTPGANGTATLSGISTNGNVGANSVTLQVTDGTLTAIQSFTITVANVNDAPTFASSPALSAMQGSLYTYNIVASDIDVPAQALTITAPTLPSWLSLTPTGTGTATLTGTPGNTNVGTNTVLVAVTDGIATTFQPFIITVSNVNDAPVFTSSPVLSGTQGAAYSYAITASDSDLPAQTLTISATSVLPAWLTLTPGGVNGTATLSGTPGNADVGPTSVTLSVSDGIATASQTFTITVANVNDAPTFTSTPVPTGTQGAAYTYSITTADIDLPVQALTITAPTLPSWLNLTPTGAGTATLTGTPGNANVGTNTVLLAVTDGIATTFQPFIITVGDVNDAPVFTSSPVLTTTQGAAYTYTITASDSDLPAQTLTFSASLLPSWLTLTPGGTNGTATLSGISTNGNVGVNLVSLQVSDGIATTTQNFTITVADVNDAPTFFSAPVLSGTQGAVYTYNVVTTDIDVPVQTLTLTAPSLPSWLALTPTGNGTATLTGTPANANVGTNTVLLAVTDGALMTFQAFVITVNNVNDAPVFTSAPVLNNTQGSLYSYTITTTDSDVPTQTLTISASTLPSWLTLIPTGNGTATLSGISTNGNVGANLVSLQVGDGIATTSQSFTITVADVNDAPTFTSSPVISGTQGAAYTYVIVTNDIDLPVQPLTISAPLLPSWLTLTASATNGQATLSGTPGNANVGSNNVILAVTDGLSTSLQTFSIVVANVNDAPVFTSIPILNGTPGSAYLYAVTANDIDLPAQTLTISATVLPTWLTLTPGGANGTASLTGTPTTANLGANAVTLQVTDGTATVTQSFTITVSNPNTPPVFASAPVSVGAQASLYTYSVVATDIDVPQQTLTLSAPILPAWLTLTAGATNGTATLSGTPGSADVGSNTVILSVSDGLATTLQSFTITVSGANAVPTISTLDPGAALVSGGGFDLIVNGTNFVPASVVNWKGLPRPTIYVNANLLIAIIPSSDLSTVGMVPVTVVNPAPGGGTSAAALFPVENPSPVVTDLSPASALAGDPNFTMTISGVNFVAGSTVNFGATALVTTFVSGTQLTATVPASAIAVSGSITVTVANAGPGGGVSNSKIFVVKPGKPVVNSPATAVPNPAIVSQNVTFAVGGVAGDGLPLTISWDFGDGTNGFGPSIIHQFTAPNTYTVTATLTDSLGTSVTSKVSVIVTAAATPPPVPQPLTITKKALKAKNPSLGKDLTTLTGSLTLPAGSAQPTTGTVIVNVGAVQQTFTLTKGIGKSGTSSFKFNKSKTLPTVTFGAKMVGNFLTVLQTAGLAPGASGPVTIPVSIVFGGNTYAANVLFTVKGTSKGSTGK